MILYNGLTDSLHVTKGVDIHMAKESPLAPHSAKVKVNRDEKSQVAQLLWELI